MPNYEYRCLNCHRRFEIFLKYNEYGQKEILCPHCQSSNIHRKIGRLRFARSDESRLENLADPANLAGLDEDPRSLGKMMRQMSGQIGEEMGPEFDEVVSRLESGQSPDDIERELPDIGGGGAGAGPDDGGFDASALDDL